MAYGEELLEHIESSIMIYLLLGLSVPPVLGGITRWEFVLPVKESSNSVSFSDISNKIRVEYSSKIQY